MTQLIVNPEVEFKNDDAGLFAARVSAFGNTDLNGDRMMEGAFKRSIEALKEAGKLLPVMWSHQHNQLPIGEVDPRDMHETADGLTVAGRMFIDDENNPQARSVWESMKRGLISAWSFAFTVPEGGEKMGEDGIREINEAQLYEVGPTLIGANPLAQTIALASGQTVELKSLMELKSPPWHVEKRDDEWCVILDEDGTTVKCHPTKADATAHMAALYANATSGDVETKRGRRHSAATVAVLARMREELDGLLTDESNEDDASEKSAPLSEADKLRLQLAELEAVVSERGR
jgi:HK97 family phage prohead protease